MKKVILWIVGIAVVLFVLIQLVPLDRSNPTPTRTVKWDSPQTQALAQRACLDCHSNETVWPWYSSVAPVSFLVTHDVKEGRENLNFSQWDQGAPEFDEIEEQIQRGSMPPPVYLLMHPTAKLSDAEKQQLIAGLEKTYQQDPTTIRERRGRGEGGGD